MLTAGETPSETSVDPARPDAIVTTLDLCLEKVQTEEALTLDEALEKLGQASFSFAALILAAPFIQPISLGPLTLASGGALIAVGWQMARGKAHLVLPTKMRGWKLHGKGYRLVLGTCRRLLLWLSRHSKCRMTGWVDGPVGTKNVGWLIFIGGVLLAVPCANLPFNNTLPALMCFCAAVAWIERDGLMAIVSVVWGLLTLVYFGLAVWAIFWAGTSLVDWVRAR